MDENKNIGVLEYSDKSLSLAKRAQAQCLLRLQAKELQRIEDYGFDSLVDLIASGMTYRDMAPLVRVSAGAIGKYVANQIGHAAQVLAAARRCAAPAYMDRAIEELEQVKGTENSCDVTIAVNLAKHYEKRASLADRANYHDKGALESTPTNLQPPSFTIIIGSQPTGSPAISISASSDLDLI